MSRTLHPHSQQPSLTLIGFGGYKKSGKDAAADALVSELGFHKDSVSFAIDAVARKLNPIVALDEQHRPITYQRYVDEICGGDFTLAKEHPEVRRFLQRLGAVGRDISTNVWTDHAEARLLKSIDDGHRYALTGVRFPSEIEMVRRHNGLLVWVSRPDVEDRSDTDPTETSVGPDDFDIVIVNDGTLADLHRKTIALVS